MTSPDPFWLGPIGVDTSKYQGRVNWQAVKDAGYSFAFIKASEGVNYADPEFAVSWDTARKANMIVGAYHFARVSKSPTIDEDAKKEAAWFASLIKDTDEMLPPILDIEWDKKADSVIKSAEVVTWCDVFTKELAQILGRTPGVYTGANFWGYRLQKTKRFAHLPLWQVHYTSATAPKKFDGWPKWTFWQWSYTQPLPGSPKTKVDANRFNGTLDELRALAQLKVAVPAEPHEPTLQELQQEPWYQGLLGSLQIVNRWISENARRGG